jgi:hypothetical protein
MDFGQNFLNKYQDEPQSTHWNHVQTTLFPIVNNYLCPEPNCGEIVTHEQIFITPDIVNHNHYTVAACSEVGLNELRTVYGLDFDLIIRVTDNCQDQFKSKGPFRHLSRVETPTIYTFFGPRHGKSSADRATGVAKKEMRRARDSRSVTLRDAKEIFDYMKSKDISGLDTEGCCHFIRTHHYIDNIDTSMETPVSGVDGTMSFHEFRSTGHRDVVECKTLACFCDYCMWGEGECEYTDWTRPWVWRGMGKVRPFDRQGNHLDNEHFPIQYIPRKCTVNEKEMTEIGTIFSSQNDRLDDVVEADTIHLQFDDDIPRCSVRLTRSDVIRQGKLYIVGDDGEIVDEVGN